MGRPFPRCLLRQCDDDVANYDDCSGGDEVYHIGFVSVEWQCLVKSD